MNDAARAGFREAMLKAGLTPPDVIVGDSKIHRFSTNGKKNDDAGWYIYYDDEFPGGVFGDWRTGFEGKYQYRNGHDASMSPAERAAYRARIAERQEARDAEQAQRQASAAVRAKEAWDRASAAPAHHEYLVRKGAKPHHLRIADDGRLIVPVRDAKELASLQFIDRAGNKDFFPGGRVGGCYCALGSDSATIVIAEGFATAASIYESTGLAAVVAFNAGNLLPVATKMRERFPNAAIVVAGDDDYRTPDNPGLTKAKVAADAVAGTVAVPDFGATRPEDATDFNDLAQLRGPDAVRQIIEAAVVLARTRPNSPTVETKGNGGKRGASAARTEVALPEALSVDDFYAYMPKHEYIYVPTRELWPAASVNSRLPPIDVDGKPQKASTWLDANRPIEQIASCRTADGLTGPARLYSISISHRRLNQAILAT
jgi:phage/plasmid primase-like uncharacterized protein